MRGIMRCDREAAGSINKEEEKISSKRGLGGQREREQAFGEGTPAQTMCISDSDIKQYIIDKHEH